MCLTDVAGSPGASHSPAMSPPLLFHRGRAENPEVTDRVCSFPAAGASGKESACPCRRRRFHPWVGDPLEKEMVPTAGFLSGESHGQRSLAGCSPWGRKESDTTEHTADSTHSLKCALGLKPGRTTRPSTQPPQGNAESPERPGATSCRWVRALQGEEANVSRVSRLPFIPHTPHPLLWLLSQPQSPAGFWGG